MITRRHVLTGLFAAPMIMRVAPIMPIRLMLPISGIVGLDQPGTTVQWLEYEFNKACLELLKATGPIPYSAASWRVGEISVELLMARRAAHQE